MCVKLKMYTHIHSNMRKIGNELLDTQMHVPMENYGHTKRQQNSDSSCSASGRAAVAAMPQHTSHAKTESTLEILYTVTRKVFWRFIN